MTDLKTRQLITNRVEDHDLDGYALEASEDAARSDELTIHLAEAIRNLRLARSVAAPIETEVPGVGPILDRLTHRLDLRVSEVVRETVETEIGGWDVNLTHSTRLDCPACEEEGVEAFYLGSTRKPVQGSGYVTGWVCGHCETEIRETEGVEGERLIVEAAQEETDE